ncbi:hypothetical protein PV327_006396 [Microctonus hyperodae]|uniref:Mitochondrial 28S ribosomal protein S27 n=1 Tax=Microctonus hyperodae TaxID=165561 RepID=A0AA39F465_MICHY|nr:hypothetical protein PV327_006396 [Microctonus hyperodae]
MLRTIRSNYLLRFYNHCPLRKCLRTFLSESYSCAEVWNRRYKSPLLSKVNPRNLYFELEQNFQRTGKISAVDVDIFINTIKDPEFVDEVINILHRLRLSAETGKTLESTHHALIRYLLDSKNEDLLLEVLHDRLNYGIFPDHYSYNLLMNQFIKEKKFASAAKVAALLMLQEDSENNLCNALGIYSCYKFLENPNDWILPAPPVPDPNEEVVKVRVLYLRNPFFDDHFDLTEPKHLVGKSLVFFGKLHNDPLGRTCQLRGYILWSKYEKAVKLIKSWIDDGVNEIIYKEAVPVIEKELSEINEDEITDDVKELKLQFEKLKGLSLKDGSVIDEMEKRLYDAVKQTEAIEINNQCEVFENWEKNRMNLLEKQLDELDKKRRLENAEKIKRDLQERERLLTFFDHEEEIELQIEQKLAAEEAEFGPVIEVSAENEENYIPPEVNKSVQK